MARWSQSLNRYVEGEEVVIAPSAAQTASGNSGWLNSEQFDNLILELDVTAASGTSPTLDVTVETAEDAAGGSPRTVGAFTQKTAASNERKSFAGLDRFYRVSWALGGTTPSFTFSVGGDLKG